MLSVTLRKLDFPKSQHLETLTRNLFMTLNDKYSTVVVGGNQGKDPKYAKFKLPPFGKHKNATVIKYKPMCLFDVNL